MKNNERKIGKEGMKPRQRKNSKFLSMQKSGFFWWGEIMKIDAQVLYKICGQDDVKKVRVKVTFLGHMQFGNSRIKNTPLHTM